MGLARAPVVWVVYYLDCCVKSSNYCNPFFFFFCLNHMHLFKVQRQPSSISSTYPAIEISTPRDYHHSSKLHPPLWVHSRGWSHTSSTLPFPKVYSFGPSSLWVDGFRLLFVNVSSPYPAFALPRLEHLHGRQHSSQRPCYRWPGTRFAVRENTSTAHGRFLYSLSL